MPDTLSRYFLARGNLSSVGAPKAVGFFRDELGIADDLAHRSLGLARGLRNWGSVTGAT
tara:strand:+ start:838 stop:1014 length:177 start_codon:yes stop_codon:yes gene_type:complete